MRLLFAALLSFPPLPPPLLHCLAVPAVLVSTEQFIHSTAVVHVHWFDVPSAKTSRFFPINVNFPTKRQRLSLLLYLRRNSRKKIRTKYRRLHVRSTVKYNTPEKSSRCRAASVRVQMQSRDALLHLTQEHVAIDGINQHYNEFILAIFLPPGLDFMRNQLCGVGNFHANLSGQQIAGVRGRFLDSASHHLPPFWAPFPT